MRLNSISAALVFALALPCAAAAELYTLRQCADYAASNSPEIREIALNEKNYLGGAAEARAARWPKFTLVTYAGPAYKVTGDADNYRKDYGVWGPYYHAKLEAQMPLWTWGKIDGYIAAAESGARAAAAEAAQKRGEVIYEVKKYYNSLLLARRLKRTVDDVIATLAEAIKKADELYQAGEGEVKKSDLEMLKVYMAEAQKNQREAAKGITLARLALMQKMGMEESPDFDIAAVKLAPQEGELQPLEHYVSTAFENRPEWRMLKSGLDARRQLLSAEKADRYPLIFLAGEAAYNNSPVRDDQRNPWLYDPYNGTSGGIVVGAKFDFAPAALTARLASKQADLDKLKEKEKFARSGIALQVRNAWETVTAARADIDSAKAGLDAAQRWVMAAGLVYALGTAGAEDALKGLAAKAKTEKDYYQAIFDYNMALADLARMCGVETPATEQE
ncbi:MAG TPA: TolC family protein [Elusimicrobiales bacterium]|nr:TolC family protein [Elusimicrobiales bacterium]